MIKGMHHTGFVVNDLDAAVQFYQDTIGLKIQKRYERTGTPIGQVVGYENAHLKIALMGAGSDHTLELIQYMSPPPSERPTEERAVLGGNHLAFLVDDIEATYEAVVKGGATALNPPAEVAPGRKACYMQDPDRNWIELLEVNE